MLSILTFFEVKVGATAKNYFYQGNLYCELYLRFLQKFRQFVYLSSVLQTLRVRIFKIVFINDC